MIKPSLMLPPKIALIFHNIVKMIITFKQRPFAIILRLIYKGYS